MQNSKIDSNYPKFAVVGHPNKGKSSIVSSLSLDDSIQIGDTPGTTQVKRGFPLKVDGKIIYELFDTPGFQRARRVLAWLNAQEPVSADKRTDVVRKFIFEHKDNKKFRDEIELLEPIVNGAGIIYVVDASKPYGSEYEIEMEIMRWCGQPSMAILNLIGKDDYREQWTSALGHYFRMVRTFNPITSTFEDHISLLDSMSQLKEEWTKPIKIAINVLEEQQKRKIDFTVNAIVENMKKTLSFTYKHTIKGRKASKKEEESSKTAYRKKIVEYENKQKREVEAIWNHKGIEKVEENLILDDIGLFSEESASVFGLSEKELLITGASAGAITGAGVDLMFAGSTFFLGSIVGGVIGGVGAKFGFNNLYETKILGKKIGQRELIIGPMKNLNFPYILLGRSLYHASSIAKRSHALRDSLELNKEDFFMEQVINSEVRKKLEELHVQLRKGSDIKDETLEKYKEVVLESFVRLLKK